VTLVSLTLKLRINVLTNVKEIKATRKSMKSSIAKRALYVYLRLLKKCNKTFTIMVPLWLGYKRGKTFTIMNKESINKQ